MDTDTGEAGVGEQNDRRAEAVAKLQAAADAIGEAAEAASTLVERDPDGEVVGWRSRILVHRRHLDRLITGLRDADFDVDAPLLNGE